MKDDTHKLTEEQQVRIMDLLKKKGMMDELIGELPEPELPEAYTDGHMYYLWSDEKQKYTQKNRTDMIAVLREAGFSVKGAKNKPLSPVQEALLKISNEHFIDRVADMAGHNHGPLRAGSTDILVTSDTPKFKDQKGDWSFIQQTLEAQLGRDDPDQVEIFKAWLSQSMRTLRNKTFRPCPALCLIGSRNTGKSLMAQHIAAPLLGGRVGKPAQYLHGKSAFNADFCGTEVLILDDEDTKHVDRKARSDFATMIKNLVVGGKVRIHAKGRDAFVADIFWRLIVCMNDSVENIQALPAGDESIEDKLIVFKLTHDFVWNSVEGYTYEQVGSQLRAALPGFAHHLLHEYEIPEHLKDFRYGVISYQNPSYRTEFLENDLTGMFHVAVQEGVFQEHESEITLRASDIYDRLVSQVSWRRVMNYFTSPIAVGKHLAKLCQRYPNQYHKRRDRENTTVWTLRKAGDAGAAPAIS